jgi:molybdopterin molybdotransferase
MQSMLSVAEAVERIIADIEPCPVERVALLDALGQVLADAVVSPVTLPAWDNAGMDGYAVRADDVAGASAESPVVLRVLETVAAGGFPTIDVTAGTATRIMTGAPLPGGADSVVRVEDSDGGRERVAISNDRDARHNVRPRGEDLCEGHAVFPAGTVIGPAQTGVLASVGAAIVDVHRRPRVAVLGSGNELVDLDRFAEAAEGRRIVSSNNYSLHALIRSAGAVPMNLGIAPDTPDGLRAMVSRSAGCDLLITTGGVSVGEFDYTRDVLTDLGADMKFWRVRMRPGAPLGFGWLGRMPWIGLPGNPVSTMVTFELFARPVIRRMLGHTRLFRRPIPVVLAEPVRIHARLTHFLRVIVHIKNDGVATAKLTGPQGSGILTSMSLANALLVVPEDRPALDAGEVLHALLLSDDATTSSAFSL